MRRTTFSRGAEYCGAFNFGAFDFSPYTSHSYKHIHWSIQLLTIYLTFIYLGSPKERKAIARARGRKETMPMTAADCSARRRTVHFSRWLCVAICGNAICGYMWQCVAMKNAGHLVQLGTQQPSLVPPHCGNGPDVGRDFDLVERVSLPASLLLESVKRGESMYKRGVESGRQCGHYRESDTPLSEHLSHQLHAISCEDLVVPIRSANKIYMTQWSRGGVSLKGGKKCVERGGEGRAQFAR